MKKILKKMFAFVVAVAILLSVHPDIQANAAVKLSTTKKTIYVGESFTLKVSGTTKAVKWSSSNKAVASVTQKGKVTAKMAGNATISAKVGKKTLKCKLTVNEQFNASKAEKNISVTLQDTGKGVVAILKNNNKVMVDVDAKLVYFSNGGMIDTSSDFTRALESGKECALFFSAPTDGNYDYVEYNDFKITLSVNKASYEKSCTRGIEIESNTGADNITAQVTNNSGMDFEFVKIAVVFYNAGGKAIGYEYGYADCLKDGSVDYLSFDYPYDSNYEAVYPSDYKIYVNEAYTNTW